MTVLANAVRFDPATVGRLYHAIVDIMLKRFVAWSILDAMADMIGRAGYDDFLAGETVLTNDPISHRHQPFAISRLPEKFLSPAGYEITRWRPLP